MYSWVSVVLHDNSLYSHQLIRIKYTSYDIQREESVIHIGTPQCNVMLLNQAYSARSWDTEHPYVYAKVLGIFHANVLYVGTLSDGTRCLDSHRIDLLWVHWYNILQAGESRETFQLDRLTLEPLDSGSALDFLDPKDVIRGVHIVPRFSQGKNPPVPKSRWVGKQDSWKAYHISRFADRDLFMRYLYGMSVGHFISSIPPDACPEREGEERESRNHGRDQDEQVENGGGEEEGYEGEDDGEGDGDENQDDEDEGFEDEDNFLDDMTDRELYANEEMYGGIGLSDY
ncbi:hypothetical protein DFP72DRAFT_829608 [Ephemerocybe angulata]|uniref:Uncharacterized protein n=1 Tax=Ephemerocybe angulata TaxID=980116 RepID=A0A8H6LVZ4_9AGAR|nr:hypothetical protein DFP72DRAFT_829608 [Tulosesus angulatus]